DDIRVIRTVNGSYPSEMRIAVTSGCSSIISTIQPATSPGTSGTAACPSAPSFGNNFWNVLCYSDNNFTNYAGYYTENRMAFDTHTRWGRSNSPSSANNLTGNAYSGCSIGNDNHS